MLNFNSKQNAALSTATQHAMPKEFGGKGRSLCSGMHPEAEKKIIKSYDGC